jgi:hypothetical protein
MPLSVAVNTILRDYGNKASFHTSAYSRAGLIAKNVRKAPYARF